MIAKLDKRLVLSTIFNMVKKLDTMEARYIWALDTVHMRSLVVL